MGALLGAVSAICIGIADVLGRRVAETNNAISLSGLLQIVAAATAAIAVVVVPSTWIGGDVALGLASGLGLGVGLAAYFHALGGSTSTVVAPLVGTLVAVLPFAYTVGTGSSVPPVAIGGAVLALGGLAVLSSRSNGATTTATQIRHGLLWGSVSGLGYGSGLTFVIETAAVSGAWPSFAQRLSAAVFTFVLAARLGLPLFPSATRRSFGLAIVSGTVSGVASLSYLFGVQIDAQPTVVMASTFPAASVIGGRLVLGDEVSARQGVGVLATLAGVALIVAT